MTGVLHAVSADWCAYWLLADMPCYIYLQSLMAKGQIVNKRKNSICIKEFNNFLSSYDDSYKIFRKQTNYNQQHAYC